jgi:hypothetical protein
MSYDGYLLLRSYIDSLPKDLLQECKEVKKQLESIGIVTKKGGAFTQEQYNTYIDLIAAPLGKLRCCSPQSAKDCTPTTDAPVIQAVKNKVVLVAMPTTSDGLPTMDKVAADPSFAATLPLHVTDLYHVGTKTLGDVDEGFKKGEVRYMCTDGGGLSNLRQSPGHQPAGQLVKDVTGWEPSDIVTLLESNCPKGIGGLSGDGVAKWVQSVLSVRVGASYQIYAWNLPPEDRVLVHYEVVKSLFGVYLGRTFGKNGAYAVEQETNVLMGVANGYLSPTLRPENLSEYLPSISVTIAQ